MSIRCGKPSFNNYLSNNNYFKTACVCPDYIGYILIPLLAISVLMSVLMLCYVSYRKKWLPERSASPERIAIYNPVREEIYEDPDFYRQSVSRSYIQCQDSSHYLEGPTVTQSGANIADCIARLPLSEAASMQAHEQQDVYVDYLSSNQGQQDIYENNYAQQDVSERKDDRKMQNVYEQPDRYTNQNDNELKLKNVHKQQDAPGNNKSPADYSDL